MKVYIAEKPSLGKEIAKSLGGGSSQKGHIKLKNGDVVTWVFGHVYEQLMPEDYNKDYKKWVVGHLPIVPKEWKLKPSKSAKDQILVIKNLLGKSTSAVNAGDADREGQLLVDELLVEMKYSKPVERIWITNMNSSGIKKANDNMKPNSKYQGFSNAALARSRADWLVGLNFTRAFTLNARSRGAQGVVSVGRVQTPTLKLVVDREREIRNFVPKDFYEVEGVFELDNGGVYKGKWDIPADLKSIDGYLLDSKPAEELVSKAKGSGFKVVVADKAKKKSKAPNPFTLTELQKACSKKFKMPAKKVLEVAQALYEKYKVATYPRSEVAYLSSEQFSESEKFLTGALKSGDYEVDVDMLDFTRKHGVFNDSKLAEHHAIIPTGEGSLSGASEMEKKVFALIVQRYAALFYPDKVTESLKVETSCAGHKFKTSAIRVIDHGWTVIDPMASKGKEEDLPNINKDEEGQCIDLNVLSKKTSPPPYFEEGTLIDAMKQVAKFIKDPAIKKKLKETSGIGTPATRGDIIERLKTQKFIEIKKSKVRATEQGEAVIDLIPEKISDPGMTALWEDGFIKIEKNEMTVEDFLLRQERFITQILDRVLIGVEEKLNKPSPKLIEFAERISEVLQLDLPDKGSRTELSAFIEENLEDFKEKSDREPSDKQVELVEKISDALNIPKPENYLTSMKACNVFLDKNFDAFKKLDGPPSEKFVKAVEFVASKKGVDLPEGYETSRNICSAFMDKHGDKPKGKGQSKRTGKRNYRKRK